MIGQLIINYNIRSLLPKKAEIDHLLMTQAPAIVAITDSELQHHHKINFPGYVMYRCDEQPRISGGALLSVRRDIPSRLLEQQPITDARTQAVSIYVRLRRWFTVTCIYRRPKARLAEAKAIIVEATQQPYHLVVRDLNARHQVWQCAIANPLGNYIVRTNLAVHHLGVHNFRHVAYPTRVSTLDLLLTRDLHTIAHCQALDYGPSDHRPVMYEIEGDPPTRLPSKYLFHKADWKGYQQDIMTSLEDIHPLRTAAEVEEAAETIS